VLEAFFLGKQLLHCHILNALHGRRQRPFSEDCAVMPGFVGYQCAVGVILWDSGCTFLIGLLLPRIELFNKQLILRLRYWLFGRKFLLQTRLELSLGIFAAKKKVFEKTENAVFHF
jgi:hypothetical protein